MSAEQAFEAFRAALIAATFEPVVVLDANFRILAANRSFAAYHSPATLLKEKHLFEIDAGQWNIEAIRTLLESVLASEAPIDGREVLAAFPLLGSRTLLVNARKVSHAGDRVSILVAISDVTERNALEAKLRRKELQLREMNHRVANSLQIIASILLIKAHTVQSEDTREHLKDAHERVLAVNRVQELLAPSEDSGRVAAGTYLSSLCNNLAASMVDGRPITIGVHAMPGEVTSDEAVSMGLITTELVINALKHAFSDDAPGDVGVRFESSPTFWRLSVADDGVGVSTMIDALPRLGLGTSILEALTRQLGGRMVTTAMSPGLSVSITVPR